MSLTLKQVSTASNQKYIWGVTPKNEPFTFDVKGQKWKKVEGSMCDVSVGFDGFVYGIGQDQQIYYFNKLNNMFQLLEQDDTESRMFRQISTAQDGLFYAVDATSNLVWMFKNGKWRQLSNLEVKYMSTSSSGKDLWAIDLVDMKPVKYDYDEKEWKSFENLPKLQDISVSDDGKRVEGISYNGKSIVEITAKANEGFEWKERSKSEKKMLNISTSGENSYEILESSALQDLNSSTA